MSRRVVLHIDVNSFYTAVEIAEDPSLRDKPVGVQQQQTLLTVNYVARNMGVPKQIKAVEAKKMCPGIVIKQIDLTKYRKASRQLFAVIRQFCGETTVMQRASIDECYLDVTERVEREAKSMEEDEELIHHGVLLGDVRTRDDRILLVADAFAHRLRMHVRREMGYETSVGISNSKTWSKIASDRNKPSNQTVVLPSAIPTLMDELPIKKVPLMGRKNAALLRDLCKRHNFEPTVFSDLQKLPRASLVETYGLNLGEFFFSLARGQDARPVMQTVAPKSYSEIAAHYTQLNSLAEVYGVLLKKVQKLCVRLEEHEELYDTRAQTLGVGFTYRSKWTEKRMSMPPKVVFGVGRTENAMEEAVAAIVSASMDVIKRHAKTDSQVIHSRRFSVSAGNFGDSMEGLKSMSEFLDRSSSGGSSVIDAMMKLKPPAKKKQKKTPPSVLEMLEKTEMCPVCSEVLLITKLNAHVNHHFEK